MEKTHGTPGQRKRAAKLLWLAREEFGRLLPGEVKMLRGAAMGEIVDLASEAGDEKLAWDSMRQVGSDWGCWDSWGEYRRVRSKLIRWMCWVDRVKLLIDAYGIVLFHSLIDGELDIDEVDVSFRIVLYCCAIPNEFRAQGARVRNLVLDGSAVKNIVFERTHIEGDLSLRAGFRSRGEVRLLGAVIEGNLTGVGGTFDGYGGCAIFADQVQVTRSMNFRNGFHAIGEVRLPGSKIGGNFDCVNGMFDGAGDSSLLADGIEVSGSVLLNGGFCATSTVRFLGSKISRNFDCTNGQFDDLLDLDRLSVGGALFFKPLKKPSVVDMTSARIWYLDDQLSSWPKKIILTDFEYRAIYPDAIGTVKERLAWLTSHDATCEGSERFNPQPYRQLAKVLRHSGHDQFADSVMYVASKKSASSRIQRQRDQGTLIDYFLAWILVIINGAYIAVVGHGYKRIRPFAWMVGLIVLGGFIFSGYRPGEFWGDANPNPTKMQQTQARAIAEKGLPWLEDYPVFRPLAYSADAFLPLVNLHQETYWTPKDGFVKTVYLPFHILAGWIVTTLAAVSVTGLVRHEKE